MNKQDLFLELNEHLIHDNEPSCYIKSIIKDPIFQEKPFAMIAQLKNTEQPRNHHPEGNVLNHTLLVVDEAAKVRDKSNDKKVFMWAALLHDIGKPATTKVRNGKLTSYNHDRVGAELSKDFLKYFDQSQQFINDVSKLIFYHMQILFVLKNHSRKNIENMKKDVDVKEVALLGLCDRLGRKKDNRKEEEENIEKFLIICEEN